MNARIRLIALAVGLALNTVALADLNPGSNRSGANETGTQVATTAAPTYAVDGSLQEMDKFRNSLLWRFSTDVEQTIELLLDNRRQFLATADAYQQSFQAAQKNYRQFLVQMKTFEESCATVDVDISGLPAELTKLLNTDKQRCNEVTAELDAKARVYAQRLDEASAFRDELDKATAYVRSQVDRLERLQKVRDLRDQVDTSLSALKMETRGRQ